MAETSTGDGLGRWLLGGLAGGAIVLALLVGAYAIGYDRGQDSVSTGAEAPPPAATTTTAETEQVDPLARGEELWASTGCAGCHTIDGGASVGPTVKGLAGAEVELDDGQTVTADDAYLAGSILDPDGQIVAGYDAGIMSAATDPQKFDTREADVEALVAYMNAQR